MVYVDDNAFYTNDATLDNVQSFLEGKLDVARDYMYQLWDNRMSYICEEDWQPYYKAADRHTDILFCLRDIVDL